MSTSVKAINQTLVKPKNMSQKLTGGTFIIIIGLGVLGVILVFIIVKRQILRFALIRSRKGPHVPIGHDGPKMLKREIERRIDLIPKIVCEPLLMGKNDPRYIVTPGQQIPAHYYRLRAVDDVKTLEGEITKQDSCLIRHPSENLRAYLLTTLAAPLNGSGQRLIHQFCDLYEHARHDPNPFGDEEHQQYNRLLLKLIDAAKLLKSYNSRKSSPNRTPHRQKQTPQEKNRNLLDPARLHPLPPNYVVDDENLTVSERIDSRPTSLTVPPLADNETSV